MEDVPPIINDPKWKKAMEEELYMIEKNKTWELVGIPRDRKVHQMDVKSTFLNGFLEEKIYKGFIMEGKEDKVYRLFKALYDLKQAPKSRYSRIDDYLLSLGFDKSLSESTLCQIQSC